MNFAKMMQAYELKNQAATVRFLKPYMLSPSSETQLESLAKDIEKQIVELNK